MHCCEVESSNFLKHQSKFSQILVSLRYKPIFNSNYPLGIITSTQPNLWSKTLLNSSVKYEFLHSNWQPVSLQFGGLVPLKTLLSLQQQKQNQTDRKKNTLTSTRGKIRLVWESVSLEKRKPCILYQLSQQEDALSIKQKTL